MYKLNLPLLVLALLIPFFVSAQGWERNFDGGHFESARNADLTLDGGLIISGVQYNTAIGANRSLLYKVAADGTLLWEYYDAVHTGAYVNTHDVESTIDGNYLHSFNYGLETENNDYLIQKIDEEGNVIWENSYPSIDNIARIFRITECSDGGFLLMGTSTYEESITIIKIDESGSLLWSTDSNYSDFNQPGDIIEAVNGDVLVLGIVVQSGSNFDPFIKRFTSDGVLVWEQLYDNNNSGDADFSFNIVEMSNGDFVLGGVERIGDLTMEYEYHPNLRRIDAQGNELWTRKYPEFNQATIRRISLQKTNQEDIVLGGSTRMYGPGDANFQLIKLDGDGNPLWNKIYGEAGNDFAVQLVNSAENGFYLTGSTSWPSDGNYIYAIKTDSEGETYVNQLSGTVFKDDNEDCLYDDGELKLSQWFIEVFDEDTHYARVTDSTGRYLLNLDTGTYQVIAHPVSPYWTICDSAFMIDFPIFNDTLVLDFAAQASVDCPLLNVSIGTPLLRRCFDNTYHVQYCNHGTLPAEDAYVEVVLDPYMEYIDASIPLTAQVEDTLTFNLGDLAIEECGRFEIEVSLEVEGEPCDSLPLGLTHCVEAHIFPDSICLPSENWSGASIEVDAICEGDSVVFYIQNVGDVPTQPNLEYIVIEDDVILYDGDVTLDAGQVEVVSVYTNGSTFRMEVDQEPNHPGMSMPSVSVEGCGTGIVEFQFGFINIYSADDADPFVDIDCRENIGAYDPNDKTGFPLGVGTPNYIEQGEAIEYLIRFQNTGTDTAFNIVVLDTLSQDLDITSIQLGASSHPFTFDVVGSRTLSFNFNNIMLPDSNVNEVASHGFVKFKIVQEANLDIGTEIHNTAAIFFDFNAPIITNQTLHTIGEDFLESVYFYPDVNSIVQVNAYPNPFDQYTKIELEGLSLKDGSLKVYDVMGRLIRQEVFRDNIHKFYKNNLLPGIYFFTIEEEGRLMASGKLIAE